MGGEGGRRGHNVVVFSIPCTLLCPSEGRGRGWVRNVVHDDARKDIDSLGGDVSDVEKDVGCLGGDVSDVEKDVGSLAKSRW